MYIGTVSGQYSEKVSEFVVVGSSYLFRAPYDSSLEVLAAVLQGVMVGTSYKLDLY
jgi:hypothetical protein